MVAFALPGKHEAKFANEGQFTHGTLAVSLPVNNVRVVFVVQYSFFFSF